MTVVLRATRAAIVSSYVTDGAMRMTDSATDTGIVWMDLMSAIVHRFRSVANFNVPMGCASAIRSVVTADVTVPMDTTSSVARVDRTSSPAAMDSAFQTTKCATGTRIVWTDRMNETVLVRETNSAATLASALTFVAIAISAWTVPMDRTKETAIHNLRHRSTNRD